MNEMTTTLIGLAFGLVLGWVAFGVNTIEDCTKIGGFTAGGKAFICEVKK